MKNNATLDYLLSPRAVRERSLALFEHARAGRTHFAIHLEKLPEVVDYVVATIRSNYPDLKIPFHSRWGHFKAANVDRVATELEPKLKGLPPEEIARIKLDLVVVSVLLDAGAGDAWKYREGAGPATREIARSEGLAVASFHMFMKGAFSDNPAKQLKASAQGLRALTADQLRAGFQVTPENPLIGVEGRLALLHGLGAALERNPTIFPGGRPGGIFDYVKSLGTEVPASRLLRAVLDGFGPIWPGRVQWEGINLGDCWHHPLLGAPGTTEALVPFHKLSQWMTYSLIEPIEAAGVRITDVSGMTGLPEYRNGGLLLDRGLISLRNPDDATRAHRPESELIVEWRAITVTLLDRIAAGVREKLGLSEAEFPLAKALEGGTWWAGRLAAREKRPDGSPPLKLESDGTVF